MNKVSLGWWPWKGGGGALQNPGPAQEEDPPAPAPAPLSHIQATEGTQMSHPGVPAAARSKVSHQPSAQDIPQVLSQLENATWPKVTSFQGPSRFKGCRRRFGPTWEKLEGSFQFQKSPWGG